MKIITRLLSSFIISMTLVSLMSITIVTAQQATSIRVNSYQINEGEQAMGLSVFLTLFDDATGKAISSGSIESGEISILDMDKKFPATVRKADTPFYIALVLDASGSMGPAAKAMRDAAKQAVDNPPQGAQFAVYQFDEQLLLIHDFTSNKDVTKDAIDKVKPRYGKGTCLYDAAYEAIDALSKTQKGRRTIILFTDGKDEKSGGGICSKHAYDQLVAFANTPASPTPINTIGMAGNENAINATELQNMAATTGGFSAIGSQGALSDLFKQVMEALNSQWLVESKLYPTVGKHSIVVQIKTGDGVPLSATLNIESSKAYTVPPDPVSINLDGMEYKADDDNYMIRLSIVSPQLINELRMSMWNAETGLKVSDGVFSNIEKTKDFTMSGKGLEAGKKYQLKIEPFDKDGKAFSTEKGENLVVLHEFSYEPKTSTSALSIVSVSIEPKTLVLNLNLQNMENVKELSGWLTDEETNVRVPNSEFKAPIEAGVLKVPVEKVPAGKYTITLQALDDKNQATVSSEYKGLVYTPVTPSIFSSLGAGIIAAPLILLGIVAIIVGVMVWLMRGSKREKVKSGTPVLQGNWEVNLNKPPAGEIPISETIILNRPKPAPNPAPAAAPTPTPTPKPATPAAGPAVAEVSSPALPPQPADVKTFIMDEAMMERVKAGIQSAGAVSAPAPVPAPQLPKVALSVKASPMLEIAGKAFMINQSPFLIGRGADNHLVILDAKISRKHAQIDYNPAANVFTIMDLGSDNGTWLYGTRLMAKSQVIIQNGATIQLGKDTQLIFQILT